MWVCGVGIGLGLVTYGVYGLITGHTILPDLLDSPGGRQDLDVYGSAAVGLSIAYIALGVLAHVHWFLGSFPHLTLLCDVTKITALLVFVGGLGFAIYRIFMAGLVF